MSEQDGWMFASLQQTLSSTSRFFRSRPLLTDAKLSLLTNASRLPFSFGGSSQLAEAAQSSSLLSVMVIERFVIVSNAV